MTNNKTLLFSIFISLSITFLEKSIAESETENLSQYDFKGKVRVIDGYTLKSGKIKIRLHGIDAPESKQACKTEKEKVYPCGYKSTVFLKSLIENKDVICLGKNKDRYNRLIAVCYSENLKFKFNNGERGLGYCISILLKRL